MRLLDHSSEALTTIKPDGSVGADFSGHVHAAGLDLDTSQFGVYPDTNTVRWISRVDGTTARFIGTSESDGALGRLDFDQLIQEAATVSAVKTLMVGQVGTGLLVRQDFIQDAAGQRLVAEIDNPAGPFIKRIIDGTERSDYLQFKDFSARGNQVGAAAQGTNGGYERVPLDGALYDVRLGGAAAQVDAANNQLNCQEAGTYLIAAQCSFAASAVGVRGLRVRQEHPAGTFTTIGVTTLPAFAGIEQSMVVVTSAVLAVGDTISMQAFQNAAASLAYNVGDGEIFLEWRRIG